MESWFWDIIGVSSVIREGLTEKLRKYYLRKSRRPCAWLGEECPAEGRAMQRTWGRTVPSRVVGTARSLVQLEWMRGKLTRNELRGIRRVENRLDRALWIILRTLSVKRNPWRGLSRRVMWFDLSCLHVCSCIGNRLKGWAEISLKAITLIKIETVPLGR